jgi:hydroxymethylpyrimidine pyrophosphatase-like HAD family hydrolase
VILGIIDGLFLINAIGNAKGIDPAKPGVADFGRDMYSDDTLLVASRNLNSSVRQKIWSSRHKRACAVNPAELKIVFQGKVKRLASREIGAVVMDFDGTVVETENRLAQPRQDIVDEFIRLRDLGIGIGFASGRGGSLGEQLRGIFPHSYLDSILVGYFNGGFILPASEDIDQKRPSKDPDIATVTHWLETHSDLLLSREVPRKEIQLTIPHKDIKNPKTFLEDMQQCDLIAQGAVRVVASGHSYDIIPSASSKLKVIERFQDLIGPDKAVISIGDCGHSEGNDHEFLARDFGISVDHICSEAHGTWSMFGAKLTGPSALQKILSSMIPSTNGGIRIDDSRLILDTDVYTWHRT